MRKTGQEEQENEMNTQPNFKVQQQSRFLFDGCVVSVDMDGKMVST